MIRKINDINLRNFTDATTYTVSSVTNTKTATILIPANTFQNGDLLSLETMFFKTNTNSTFTWKMYYNTSNSLTGAVQIGTNTTAANTVTYEYGYRRASIIIASGGGSGSELGTEVINSSSNLSTDLLGNVGQSYTNLAINVERNSRCYSDGEGKDQHRSKESE